jgi:hypothetical protein
MWAVILICGLALRALEARPHLGSHADAVALFDPGPNGLADLDSLADHLMADTERAFIITPAARYSMDIRATHAARLDLYVNVIVPERLGSQLFLLELIPCLGPATQKPSKMSGYPIFGVTMGTCCLFSACNRTRIPRKWIDISKMTRGKELEYKRFVPLSLHSVPDTYL